MLIGTTFSAHHLVHLGLPVAESLRTATNWGFSHIRLGSYWNELEIAPGKFNWKPLLAQLKICEAAHQPVVLTIGCKAPRWPEFYIPDWYSHLDPESEEFVAVIEQFLTALLKVVAPFSCITHWQVENEPYLPIWFEGTRKKLPQSLVQRELALVRAVDDRPCMLTTFGNHCVVDRSLLALTPEVAVIGIDLYPKLFVRQLFGFPWYAGITLGALLPRSLRQCQQPIWITELQAEPWEQDDAGYRSDDPKSMSPNQLEKNLQLAQSLPATETLLWGFEYWLWREQRCNDSRYSELVKKWLQTS